MKNKVVIITGEQGEGKTSFIQEVIAYMKKKNVKPGGLIALGYWKNNTREKFELQNLLTNEKIIFCKVDPERGWEKIRKFYINPKGKAFGERALDPKFLKTSDVIIIDEIGPFELEGKGWARPLSEILEKLTIPLILVVRKSLLEKVINHWNIEDYDILEFSKTSPGQIFSILTEN